MSGNSIALVDDDKNILSSLALFFEAEGFEVSSYTDPVQFLESFKVQPFDLVTLDVKMPKLDGLEVVKVIRETSKVPVIMLTSKDEEIDEIIGLRAGADDYIRKPFSQRLLLERVRTLLRRNKIEEKFSAIGALSIDVNRHTVKWKGIAIDLSITEFLILKSLVDIPGQAKTRQQLIDTAYGLGVYVDDRVIDTHIKRIRKKFKDIDAEFSNVESLYGLGYKYRES